jgi:hypothetical protein
LYVLFINSSSTQFPVKLGLWFSFGVDLQLQKMKLSDNRKLQVFIFRKLS